MESLMSQADRKRAYNWGFAIGATLGLIFGVLFGLSIPGWA